MRSVNKVLILQFHPDKTVHFVIGSDAKKKEIKSDIAENPLLKLWKILKIFNFFSSELS